MGKKIIILFFLTGNLAKLMESVDKQDIIEEDEITAEKLRFL